MCLCVKDMLITGVQLRNIKNHAEAEFKFLPGVIAICGPNGSGKTTIIEAIAWALFDHLDYKKDDFVKRGSKRGQVVVSFASKIDGKIYTVIRDTGGGYYVHDPELNLKIAEQKSQVVPWLREHIGAEPGTDLSSLFKTTIGVPQGMFTADFTLQPAARKTVFDSILKVEEYRNASDNLRDTVRFIEQNISQLDKEIAEAEGQLKNWDELKRQFDDAGHKLQRFLSDLSEATQQRDAKIKEVDEFNKLKTSFDTLTNSATGLRLKADLTRTQLASAQTAEQTARNASITVEKAHIGYTDYLDAVKQSKELDEKRIARDQLRNQATAAERELIESRSRLMMCHERLNEVTQARNDLTSITPKLEEQTSLENKLASMREARGEMLSLTRSMDAIDKDLDALRTRYTAITRQIEAAEAHKARASTISILEVQIERDTELLAHLKATTSRDEEMISAIEGGGMCPLLSEKCLNLNPGESVIHRFGSELESRKSKIRSIQSSLPTLREQLRIGREAAITFSSVEVLKPEQTDIKQQGENKKQEKLDLDKRLADLGDVETIITEINKSLSDLGNPKSRAHAMEQTIVREEQWKNDADKIEANIARINQTLEQLSSELHAFDSLDVDIVSVNKIRIDNESDYQAYISNEKIAASLSERETATQAIQNDLDAINTALINSEQKLNELNKRYDAERHSQCQYELNRHGERIAQCETQIDNTRTTFTQLQEQITVLEAVREKMRNLAATKDKSSRNKDLADFVRDILLKAAPFITESYLYSISSEANLLFREITGRYDLSLRWTREYEIVLEEEGRERPFHNLSGGEQMAAALSVRMALLKELSDINIAFFDEPTVNMDEERRRNLAQQIGRIKDFKQLFVISHDDSFEEFTDQTISL